ncbi:MAG: phosphodiesterase [Bacilli bacterium]|jgi:uncharacterized protein|nr:phosphodiesterase [Bacilli bacterium]
MKLMIISDTHGYLEGTMQAYKIFERSHADYLVILGDLFNFGPKNGINPGYDALKTAEYLKQRRDKLIVIRGNCDANVDDMLLGIPVLEHNIFDVNGRKVFCTHGHIYSENNLPNGLQSGDILLRGHFHIPLLLEEQGIIVACPGSIGVPKGGSKPAYILLDEHKLECFTLDGEQLYTKDL